MHAALDFLESLGISTKVDYHSLCSYSRGVSGQRMDREEGITTGWEAASNSNTAITNPHDEGRGDYYVSHCIFWGRPRPAVDKTKTIQ